MTEAPLPLAPCSTWARRPAWGKVLTGLALASCMATPALAQGVYRIVGPDGRVTFSDQPPASDAARLAPPATSSTGAAGQANLPYALRQATGRFPVTLYTGTDCSPCNSGRSLLNARGIPYTEKTITTTSDAEALKRLSGSASLPVLTIGTQQIKGFSDTEWTQFLNAAGYPAQSVLPASYRRPEPSPLVSSTEAAPAASARGAAPAAGTSSSGEQPAAVPEPAVSVTPSPSNPAGIRF
jgi:glutaredoxin